MITWVDRDGVVHTVAYGRPNVGRRVTWVTQCQGNPVARGKLRHNLNPTCIDCILEEE